MFDKEYLHSLPNDPIEGAKKIIEDFLSVYDEIESDDCMKAYWFLSRYILKSSIMKSVPGMNEEDSYSCNSVYSFFKAMYVSIIKMHFDNEIEDFFGENTYEISVGDKERISSLILAIRDTVEKSTAIDDDHKERIFSRLNLLQVELDKKRTNFDKLLGGVVRIGIVLNKFGEDAKPSVERIQELGGVLYRLLEKIEKIVNPTTPAIPLLKDNSDAIDE